MNGLFKYHVVIKLIKILAKGKKTHEWELFLILIVCDRIFRELKTKPQLILS